MSPGVENVARPRSAGRVTAAVVLALGVVGLTGWRVLESRSAGESTGDVSVVAGLAQTSAYPQVDSEPVDNTPAAEVADAEFLRLEPVRTHYLDDISAVQTKPPAGGAPTAARDGGEIEFAGLEPQQSRSETGRSPWQQPADAEPYIWHDGERTLRAWLDPELVVRPDADGVARDEVIAGTGSGIVTRSDGTDADRKGTQPVFRSDSGELMALPGGVLLVLDPDWDDEAVDAFFSRNSVSDPRSRLDYVPNGFFIETLPGFASLNLANELAGQTGVVVSSPNWWVERVAK